MDALIAFFGIIMIPALGGAIAMTAILAADYDFKNPH